MVFLFLKPNRLSDGNIKEIFTCLTRPRAPSLNGDSLPRQQDNKENAMQRMGTQRPKLGINVSAMAGHNRHDSGAFNGSSE